MTEIAIKKPRIETDFMRYYGNGEFGISLPDLVRAGGYVPPQFSVKSRLLSGSIAYVPALRGMLGRRP